MKKRKKNFSALVTIRFSKEKLKKAEEAMKIRSVLYGHEGETFSDYVRAAVDHFTIDILRMSE